MAETLIAEFEDHIEAWELVPGRDAPAKSGWGMFEISIDGALVYSKKATGKHIELDEFRKLIQDRIA
jgi:selenoprotein W-related protein